MASCFLGLDRQIVDKKDGKQGTVLRALVELCVQQTKCNRCRATNTVQDLEGQHIAELKCSLWLDQDEGDCSGPSTSSLCHSCRLRVPSVAGIRRRVSRTTADCLGGSCYDTGRTRNAIQKKKRLKPFGNKFNGA